MTQRRVFYSYSLWIGVILQLFKIKITLTRDRLRTYISYGIRKGNERIRYQRENQEIGRQCCCPCCRNFLEPLYPSRLKEADIRDEWKNQIEAGKEN